MNPLVLIPPLLLGYMTCWFLVSIYVHRNDVADIAWGLGFILVAWASYGVGIQSSSACIINILVTVWGLRLAIHIFMRNRGKSEDSRYRAWRDAWGKWFYVRSYFQVYFLQGVLLLLVAIPIIFVNSVDGRLHLLTLLGILIWLCGFYFESVGDYQLMVFKRNPQNKGKVMQTGLWNYTRHPNYFGEVTQWWGIYLAVVGIPNGWITIIGPLTITYLILGLSGVPMLEKRYLSNKEYEEYKKRVSAFFPRFPRNL